MSRLMSGEHFGGACHICGLKIAMSTSGLAMHEIPTCARFKELLAPAFIDDFLASAEKKATT